MAQEIHVKDIGTVFEVTLEDNSAPVDLNGSTGLSIIFRNPPGTVVIKVATIVNPPGTDGKIQYVTIADDLDCAGDWSIQAEVVFPTGTFRSEVKPFEVFENL